MPRTCIVVGCCNRANDRAKKFWRIPATRDRRGRECPIKTKRRNLWIAALKRVDLTENKLKHASICSDHFISGKPAEQDDYESKDYVPSRNMGNLKQTRYFKPAAERHQRNLRGNNRVISPSNTKIDDCIQDETDTSVVDYQKDIAYSTMPNVVYHADIQIQDDKPGCQIYKIKKKGAKNKLHKTNVQGQRHKCPTFATKTIEHVNVETNHTFSTSPPPSDIKLEVDDFRGVTHQNSIKNVNLTITNISYSTTLPLCVKLEEGNFEEQTQNTCPTTSITPNSVELQRKNWKTEATSTAIPCSKNTHGELGLDPLSFESRPVTLSMSICRVCMQKEGQPMIAIDCLVGDDNESTIQEMLSSISCVQASVNDGLPPRVCEECLQRILDAYQLKKQYEISNATMLEMLRKVREENELVIKETDENYSSSFSKDSERIFCQECNVTVLKPDLYTHMLKCKMNTSAINISSNKKKILICRGCNYLIYPNEMSEHRKSCNKEIQIASAQASSTKDCKSVNNELTYIDNIISNISQDHFVPELVRNSTLSKIKEQFNNDFKIHKHKTKPSDCEIINQGERMNEVKNEKNQEKPTPIPESLITLKKNINLKFMKEKMQDKPSTEDAVLMQCTVCNVQIYDREIEFHKTICKPPQPTFWTINKEGTYSCKLCKKTDKFYDTLAALRMHISQHNALRAKILCSTCGRSVRKSMWKNHQNLHSGIKPYTCDICNQKFSVANYLTNHMRRHTQEKPYKCNFCLKQFCRQNNLAVHKRVHTGEKPYSCVICGKSFTTCGNMHVHMKTHDVTEMDASAINRENV